MSPVFLMYGNLPWSDRPLRNSIMSCSVLLWLWKTFGFFYWNLFEKKNLFNETVWVTKQPPLLIIAFLTRGIFGSCRGRDLSRFWMIHPLVEHNQRLPYQNSGAFHADTKPWIQSAGQQNRTEKPVSMNGCSSMNKEIGASTFKISSLQPHCSVKGSWNEGLGSEGQKPFTGRTSALSVIGWLWT